jgi:hypothetical protein
MKYFDVHTHYGIVDWSGKAKIPTGYTPNEYYEEQIVKCCKKLDMVVAVNGFGLSNNGYLQGKTICVDMNNEVEKFFKKNEKHIVGMGFVDLDYHTPLLIDDLFRRGFKGIKLIMPKHRWDYKGYYEFYKRCEYFEMPILFHTGINGLKSYFKEDVNSYNTMPIFLEDIGVRFPKLAIIGAHLGFGYYEEASCLVDSFKNSSKNIYFDITGEINTLRKITGGKWVKKEVPCSALVWGLDMEYFNYENYLNIWEKHFDEINLSQEEQDQIFYKNAAKLFKVKY